MLRISLVLLRLPLVSLLLGGLLLSGCLDRQDAMAPIIAIYDPPSGTVQSLSTPNVFGYVMDDVGIRSIKVDQVDLLEAPAYASERGKKLIQFGFRLAEGQEGDFSATITAEDVNGRTTTMAYVLQIDQTPPTIELFDVSRVSGNRLRISGIARDNIAVKSIEVAGVVVPFFPSTEQAFNLDVDITDNMQIVVTDEAGNRTVQQLNP